MRNTKCINFTLLFLIAINIVPIYGQLITCIPWMQTRSISCNCSDNFAVFIDNAYIKKVSHPGACAPSDDGNCSATDIITEYARTVCFNRTTCVINFRYQDHACAGFHGSLYVYVRHRCQPVFGVDRKKLLPSAVIGGHKDVDQSGFHVMIHSSQYPGWIQATHLQCRVDIPASTVVRLDVMDLSYNSSSSDDYKLNLGNTSNSRSFKRGSGPTTLFWNNTRSSNVSIKMFFTARHTLTAAQYAAIFMRFYIFLSVVDFDNTYSNHAMRITCPSNSKSTADEVTPVDNTTSDSNANMTSESRLPMRSNDYNIVAVIAGATAGALMLVVIVSIISVILGTRQRKRRKPPTPTTDQELRYHVHANMMAASKMQAILENRENIPAMQQVKDLNQVIITSSTSDFGTVDSRAPLESYMTNDVAEDSAYDSSTEPVRSLEDLNFASNPRRPYLQSQDNPLFFSLHRQQDGNPKPARVRSMHIERPKYDHQYQNHEVVEKSKPPRPKSALAFRDHEYVNDFLPRRPTKRKGSGPLRRSYSQHYKRSGRHTRPQRTHSWYNTRVDYVKSPEKPKDGVYYNTQPHPQMRKKPGRLQTIPSAGSADFSTDDNDNLRRFSANNNNYSFHIMGSTQSLGDTYGYPSSIDRQKEQPRGLLFFSNNSIHAMVQDKRSVPLEQLYAIPQKKKKTGFVKLSGADGTPADHEA